MSARSWQFRSEAAAGTAVLLMWVIAVPVLAIVLVPVLVSNLGTSWSARFGPSTPGTFTAVYEECRTTRSKYLGESRSCTWRGDFNPTDGGVVRHRVVLAGADDVDRAGVSAPALDTGDPNFVYPPKGWSWLVDIVFFLLALGVVALWARSIWRAVATWRRDRQAVFEEYGV